jgi:putative endonuclease
MVAHVGSSGSAAGTGRGRAVCLGKRALGRAGEDLAARWYLAQGYEVVARNWSTRWGEIDIIARQGALTVFCEVKVRSSSGFGAPAEAVGPSKQARLRRLAAVWFAEQARVCKEAGRAAPLRQQQGGISARPWRARRRGGPVRFDVASVMPGSVEVLEGAF